MAHTHTKIFNIFSCFLHSQYGSQLLVTDKNEFSQISSGPSSSRALSNLASHPFLFLTIHLSYPQYK